MDNVHTFYEEGKTRQIVNPDWLSTNGEKEEESSDWLSTNGEKEEQSPADWLFK